MGLFRSIRKLLSRDVMSVMVPCILISLGLWYIIKLGHTYETAIPVNVRVEGQRIRVSCTVRGTGFRLVAHRYVLRKDIDVKLSDVEAVPSVVNRNSYVLDPFSLQNIISLRNSDLRVISVGEIPEITLKTEE